ncbi:DUF397 domain-containing protein [Streptomyces sp. NPDC059080]|uniref:DUF397 domain-containing protein n=1 Tax=Streptomyces sp. NPDC059080 TaxID=3346718 RepID=UPI003688C253
MTPPNPSWVKSSYSSQDGGNCLEWSPASATATHIVPVRDSKLTDSAILTPNAHAWASFIGAVKGGQFGA